MEQQAFTQTHTHNVLFIGVTLPSHVWHEFAVMSFIGLCGLLLYIIIFSLERRWELSASALWLWGWGWSWSFSKCDEISCSSWFYCMNWLPSPSKPLLSSHTHLRRVSSCVHASPCHTHTGKVNEQIGAGYKCRHRTTHCLPNNPRPDSLVKFTEPKCLKVWLKKRCRWIKCACGIERMQEVAGHDIPVALSLLCMCVNLYKWHFHVFLIIFFSILFPKHTLPTLTHFCIYCMLTVCTLGLANMENVSISNFTLKPG